MPLSLKLPCSLSQCGHSHILYLGHLFILIVLHMTNPSLPVVCILFNSVFPSYCCTLECLSMFECLMLVQIYCLYFVLFLKGPLAQNNADLMFRISRGKSQVPGDTSNNKPKEGNDNSDKGKISSSCLCTINKSS